MYEAFYGFREQPFSLLPDPDFLYLGKKHKLAYAMLAYGLYYQAGFSVITGEIGSGKTTLIQHMLKQVKDNVTVGLMSNTHRDMGELLQWVLLAFDQDYAIADKVGLYDAFNKFLIDQYAKNQRTVLIIDEAQNLEPLVLEELRMLSNINANKDQVLQMILVGQPELKATLQRPELLQFAQRIAVDFHLSALNEKETRGYILHRTRHAGREQALFTDKASDLIYQASGGVPRVINVLCETALVYGFAEQQQKIDQKLVADVLKDKSDHSLVKHDASAPPEPEDKVQNVTPFDLDMAKQLFGNYKEK